MAKHIEAYKNLDANANYKEATCKYDLKAYYYTDSFISGEQEMEQKKFRFLKEVYVEGYEMILTITTTTLNDILLATSINCLATDYNNAAPRSSIERFVKEVNDFVEYHFYCKPDYNNLVANLCTIIGYVTDTNSESRYRNSVA